MIEEKGQELIDETDPSQEENELEESSTSKQQSGRVYLWLWVAFACLCVILLIGELTYKRLIWEGWTRLTEANGFDLGEVVDFKVASDGAVWVASTNPAFVHRFTGSSWETFETNHTLAEDDIWAVAIAPDAGLWIGTDKGIYQYANETWTTYTTEDGLVGNDVNYLEITSDGQVWAGFHEGVSHFDGVGWISYTTNNGLSDGYVWVIEAAPDNSVWFGTTGYHKNERGDTSLKGSIAHYDGESMIDYSRTSSPKGGYVIDLAVAPDGNLWAVGGDGLFINRGLGWYLEPNVEKLLWGIEYRSVGDIAISSDNVLWVLAFSDSPIFAKKRILKLEENKWTSYYMPTKLPVYELVVDQQNRLWIGTKSGLFIFNQYRGASEITSTILDLWEMARLVLIPIIVFFPILIIDLQLFHNQDQYKRRFAPEIILYALLALLGLWSIGWQIIEFWMFYFDIAIFFFGIPYCIASIILIPSSIYYLTRVNLRENKPIIFRLVVYGAFLAFAIFSLIFLSEGINYNSTPRERWFLTTWAGSGFAILGLIVPPIYWCIETTISMLVIKRRKN